MSNVACKNPECPRPKGVINHNDPVYRLSVTQDEYMGDRDERVQIDAGTFCSKGCLAVYLGYGPPNELMGS